jgi:hypothetical protein
VRTSLSFTRSSRCPCVFGRLSSFLLVLPGPAIAGQARRLASGIPFQEMHTSPQIHERVPLAVSQATFRSSSMSWSRQESASVRSVLSTFRGCTSCDIAMHSLANEIPSTARENQQHLGRFRRVSLDALDPGSSMVLKTHPDLAHKSTMPDKPPCFGCSEISKTLWCFIQS